MTSVEFVWSRSGNDEAFLADMKTAMAGVTDPLETVKIVYDPCLGDFFRHELLGDACAPWLAFLAENVVVAKKIVFDVSFTTEVGSGNIWYTFTSHGDAGRPFQDLMKSIDDAARRRGADVTICGVAYPDMMDTIIHSIGPNPAHH
jgi:hypothetical protein